jgi:hypothetical protein
MGLILYIQLNSLYSNSQPLPINPRLTKFRSSSYLVDGQLSNHNTGFLPFQLRLHHGTNDINIVVR